MYKKFDFAGSLYEDGKKVITSISATASKSTSAEAPSVTVTEENGAVALDIKLPENNSAVVVDNGDGKVKIESLSTIEITDPTVPDWARSQTKPTYTAEEVGAIPNTSSIPRTLAQLIDDPKHRTVTDDEKILWSSQSTNKPYIAQVVLPVSDWDNETHTQTINIQGISADATSQFIMVSAIPECMIDAVDSVVICSDQGDNTVTFHCDYIPQNDITMNISWQNAVWVQ